mmetsp:Transcript_3455/g.5765  ORF Transcript_3455/g.5765 Transcript_3455/m.5765 type:complete len:447 (+) Transcript_3455:75-1415(+)|eukprot:CAMPEP_0119027558 /NCGR_PEP_ID=MMETSP1176-20130426/37284_1 /TAXON_ID=265551 /ORGANISM="Synedropsis recta cf, Strain CCMP1620" /LENGTH=446 /DNA_ID=CAMNT_0006983499 /DNA_START=53 /DNA_END=1393 /DNA_ORIENTATION=-
MMSRLLWKSLLLLSVAVLSLGETVEVSANGEATADTGVVCPPECASDSTEWKQRIAELEQSKAGLTATAQSCEVSTNELSKQLQDAIKHAEATQVEKDTVGANCDSQLQILQASVLEAAGLQKTLEQSSQECSATLDLVIEREKQFKVEADSHFTAFRAEIEDLGSHKLKASEMAGLVETLSRDLDTHKLELSSTRDSLTKDLEDHQAKLREKADSYSQSKKELFQANERLRELDLLVATTYVNTTLIQQDIAIGANKIAVSSVEGWRAAVEAVHPYWVMLVDFVVPHWNNFLVFYNETILVEVSKGAKAVGEKYDEHVKPSLEEHVFPVIEPVTTPIKENASKLHGMASSGLKQGCQSLLQYLDLMETKDSAFQTKITAILQWAEKDSAKALNYMLMAVAVMFVLWRLRSRVRRRKDKIKSEPLPAHAKKRKGLQARGKKGGPTQ